MAAVWRDGTTVPDDVGWGKVAANKRSDYVGRRSLWLPEHLRADRLQLVGLKAETNIVIGGHLRIVDSSEVTDGWVTSAGRTVVGNEPIALAMMHGGRERMGSRVDVRQRLSQAGHSRGGAVLRSCGRAHECLTLIAPAQYSKSAPVCQRFRPASKD
ncbi:MAG: hypothetical protein JWO52_6633 [Gammaproteobacteria bacterium]|nr:hypothetical protein [Gammaproteobacteria bacterium]